MTGIFKPRDPYAFLQRDAQRARLSAQQAQNYIQVGKVLITAQSSADESTFDVTFARVFTEEPVFTFGSVLQTNVPAVSGSFPTASATVIEWDLITIGPFNGYLGATVAAVTTGISSQQLWLHYTFTGKALSFPAGLVPTSGSVTA